jgi:hypothetical protein
MAQQDTLIHVPAKMRRSVRDTRTMDTVTESRFECPACHRSVWRSLAGHQPTVFMCNGLSVATVLPMPNLVPGLPSPEETIDVLRETLRHNTLHPQLRLRIISLIRRLRSVMNAPNCP